MNLQHLQQKNGMLLMIRIRQNMVKEMKVIQALNLKKKSIKPSLCGYSDAYILVTGNITAAGGNENASVAFKNCAPFTKCVTHINDEHIDTAENLDTIVPMYNLTEFSENYSGLSGKLWQFKRDEQNMNNRNPENATAVDSTSFKYKSNILENPAADGALKICKSSCYTKIFK